MTAPGTPRVKETVARANRIVKAYSLDIARLLELLVPGRTVTFNSGPWPSIVNRVAELAGSATLHEPKWTVQIRNSSWTIDAWHKRAEHTWGEPFYTPEEEAAIGDNPEVIYCEREGFLRDSELAVKWLVKRLTDNQLTANLSQRPEMAGLINNVEAELGAWWLLDANRNSDLDRYESQAWEAWIARLRSGKLTDPPTTQSVSVKAAANVVVRQWTIADAASESGNDRLRTIADTDKVQKPALEASIEPKASADGRTPQEIALKEVLDAGLVGVLHAAAKSDAVSRADRMMRKLFESDKSKYGGWSQRRWAGYLSQSTATIAKTDAWREIRAWQASNKEARRVS